MVNFKVAVTEVYPWVPWELVADPLGSSAHNLGTTVQVACLLLRLQVMPTSLQ
jgi:hypothetical protein